MESKMKAQELVEIVPITNWMVRLTLTLILLVMFLSLTLN
jgi:hypothetical protein